MLNQALEMTLYEPRVVNRLEPKASRQSSPTDTICDIFIGIILTVYTVCLNTHASDLLAQIIINL